MNSTQKFELLITSPPHRDSLVAEIWWQNMMVGEIRIENGTSLVELYGRPDGEPWLFRAEDFLAAVKKSKEGLER